MGQTLTKNHRKTKNKSNPSFESREEYFIRNGGILLEKQIALSQGQRIVAGQLKIFSHREIQKATNNYDLDLIVHVSDLRIVYRATLEDRIVAVKAPPEVEPHPILVEHHLTEASMSMVMNHENIVRLYGCCLETCVPILVHEFFPNRSLFEHLHVDIEYSKGANWADCLRVAIETGYALSYMHNALSKPIVHRHLSSRIILVDYSFHSKLSNFGFAVAITPGETTTQKWPIEGVLGYTDPEYIETQELTEKCDVYSFGVLLLEILTRKQPSMMARCGTDLVSRFVSAVKKNCLIEMIDKVMLEQAKMHVIQQVAQLALTCVAEKGTERPTMIDVVKQLWEIRGN